MEIQRVRAALSPSVGESRMVCRHCGKGSPSVQEAKPGSCVGLIVW